MLDHRSRLALLALVAAPCLLGSCDEARPSIPNHDPSFALAHAAEHSSHAAVQEPSFSTSKTKTPVCGPAGVTTPPADLCPSTRLVGYFPNNNCPTPAAGWTVETLFAGSKTPIGRYCRYVWPSDGTPTLLGKSLRSQLQPDCLVSPQSPMAASLAPHYDQAFGEAAQTIPSASPLPDGQSVLIAVVDTAPRQTKVGQSKHGPTVAALAAALASGCVPGLDEADCRRKVVTELGLPQTRTGPDTAHGGYFGYQSELAEGIVRVLDGWPEPNAGDQKLVLNLSVGWEPKPDEFDNPSPAVRAVRDALAIAECRGALIVAASGNRPPGTCVTAATAPGAWAAEPGMTAAQCQGLGLAPADIHLPAPLHAYHPFLHAATPLGWDQGNLADFREGSNAKLAAVGFAGFDSRASGNHGPISGSSVSTTVVSGAAALVWSYFPNLGADALVQLLYDGGSSTSRTASVALFQPNMLIGPAQRQVSACSAMRQACDHWQSYASAQPGVCSNSAVGACPNAGPAPLNASGLLSAFDQAFAQLPPGDVGYSNGPAWTTLDCAGCNGQPRRVQLPPGMNTEPASRAWVLPQPQKAPCPICKIKSDKFYVSLDPTYDNYSLVDMTVTLTDAAGVNEVLYYGAAVLPTLSSRTVEVITDGELVGVGAVGSAPVRAHVQMTFGSGTSVISAGNEIPVE